MKISPLSANGLGAVGAQAPAPAQTRTFKMNTNATPGHLDELPSEGGEPSNPSPDGATSEVTQPLSPQFAALAKQRRALQVKEREIADREKALQTQPTSAGVDVARLKSDPLGVLLEAGVTYDQLTEAVLAHQDGSSEISALKAKIEALEEGVDKKLSDRDQQTKQSVLAEMKREATQLAATGEDFELVRETRSIPHVMTLIEKTYDETGEVLDVREAMSLVEEELFKDAQKLANLKKVQAKFAPQPAPVPPPQSHRQMRTLTNRDTAQVPMSAKQRALAAFNGTLRR